MVSTHDRDSPQPAYLSARDREWLFAFLRRLPERLKPMAIRKTIRVCKSHRTVACADAVRLLRRVSGMDIAWQSPCADQFLARERAQNWSRILSRVVISAELTKDVLRQHAVVLGVDIAGDLGGDSEVRKRAQQMTEEQFWVRRIRKAREQAEEAVFLWVGAVGEYGEHYVSNFSLARREARDRAFRERAEGIYLINRETGQKIRLSELLGKASRVDAERYALLKGVEERAAEFAWVCSFLTVTLPAALHPNPANRESCWCGVTPNEAVKVLQQGWKCVRAQLHKRGIGFMAVRVVEPHKDGAPHLHIMIWHAEAFRSQLDAILRSHWGRNQMHSDTDDLDIRHNTPALEIRNVNPNRGSASSYLFKYITGATDEKSPKRKRTDAWNRLWGVRKFQWSGIKSCLGEWRAIRKFKVRPEGRLGEAWDAATQGRFNDFMHLCEQGAVVLAKEQARERNFFDKVIGLDGKARTRSTLVPSRYRRVIGLIGDFGELIRLPRYDIKSVGATKPTVTVIDNSPRGASRPAISANAEVAGAISAVSSHEAADRVQVDTPQLRHASC